MITIQYAASKKGVPTAAQLQHYAKTVLAAKHVQHAEITIRIVDADEIQALNKQYRNQNKPTDILSFTHQSDPLIGDIAICASVVNQAAIDQGKDAHAHWAHLVVHGMLHLLSFDHMRDEDAAVMEQAEIAILAKLGVDDPY